MKEREKIDSNKKLALQFGESERQIRRYIRLTNLIPKILDMVDEEKIAFTVAVELSYLNEEIIKNVDNVLKNIFSIEKGSFKIIYSSSLHILLFL